MNKSKVFISYSRKDDEFARRLADDLRAAGYEVWIDISGLRGGQEWVGGIETAVRDCDAFVPIISPDSIASQWVKRETLFAQGLKKPIVPVMLQGIALPVHLIDIHCVDFRGAYDDAVQKLIQTLPPPEPGPSPTTAPPDTAPVAKTRNRLDQLPSWIWGVSAVIVILAVVIGAYAAGVFTNRTPGEEAPALPPSTGQVIVDNADPGFTVEAGDWGTCPNGACGGTCYGSEFRWAEPGCTSCQARFDLNVAATGEYDVWTWWPRGDDRATDTLFTIRYSDGPLAVSVDQQKYGDTWYWLGTLALEADESVSILVEGSDTGYADADAIALTPTGAGPPSTEASEAALTPTTETD